MVAVRDLLSTLNSLAQSGLLASGWLRRSVNDRAARLSAQGKNPPPEQWEDDDLQDCAEPLLEDLLHDPVVELMMQADRQEPEQVRRLLASKRTDAVPPLVKTGYQDRARTL